MPWTPPPTDLELLMTGSDDLRSVVRQLALRCVEREADIRRLRDASRDHIKGLEEAVAAVPDSLWASIFVSGAALEAIWSAEGVAAAAGLLEALPPLAEYAMLRALTPTGLAKWFAQTSECLRLRQGDVIPSCERPLRNRAHATPSRSTLGVGHLLEGLPFTIFTQPDGQVPAVELDFSYRELLEPICWVPASGNGAEPRLPRVATLHPYEEFATEYEYEVDAGDHWFFNVRPKAVDQDWLLSHLRAAAALAEIAVLPELSLRAPDDLGGALAANPADVPPLVVAGSAHVTDDAGRSNLSVTYLDGIPVLEHRKIHPMVLSLSGGVRLRERLTDGPHTVRCLCCSQTRMAVTICADLIDRTIPTLLQQVGVNVLLVPALSPHEGSFNSTATGLAGHNQGVTVIVNGSPVAEPGEDPFMILAGAPFRRPRDQSRSFPPPAAGRRTIGWIDPNEPLGDADPWAPPPPLP